MKTTVKKIFAANGFRLARGPKSRTGGVQRQTSLESTLVDGVWRQDGSRTASKRALGRCYRHLARNGGWL